MFVSPLFTNGLEATNRICPFSSWRRDGRRFWPQRGPNQFPVKYSIRSSSIAQLVFHSSSSQCFSPMESRKTVQRFPRWTYLSFQLFHESCRAREEKSCRCVYFLLLFFCFAYTPRLFLSPVILFKQLGEDFVWELKDFIHTRSLFFLQRLSWDSKEEKVIHRVNMELSSYEEDLHPVFQPDPTLWP